MAKWDLSKLPEGRKPLPDEWFAERAQMQERIEELEAKLAKAVQLIDDIFSDGEVKNCDCELCKSHLERRAELTGGKDE